MPEVGGKARQELPSERRARNENEVDLAILQIRNGYANLNDEQRATLREEWPLLYRGVKRLTEVT